MAKRRMFSNEVVESDAFCSLHLSAQSLYFHLCMNADDDGFVDKWKSILRYLKVKSPMLDELIEAGLLIDFPDEVLLVSDWRRHNTIKLDRYAKSSYSHYLTSLLQHPNGRYFKASEVFLDPQYNQN